MSIGMNKVFLLGNLGADPELRWTKAGKAALNFRLATTETYLDKSGERREVTNWHRAVLWGRRGEALAKILHAGSRVMVEGNIRNSSWDDKDGTKRFTTEVNVREIYLLSSRSRSASALDEDATPTGELGFGSEGRSTGANAPFGAEA